MSVFGSKALKQLLQDLFFHLPIKDFFLIRTDRLIGPSIVFILNVFSLTTYSLECMLYSYIFSDVVITVAVLISKQKLIK